MRLLVLVLFPLLAWAQAQPQFWRANSYGAIPANGLSIALDAHTIAGVADGGAVSGNGWTDHWRTHTSSTPNTAPIYRATGLNGRPGVEFQRAVPHGIDIADPGTGSDLDVQYPYAAWWVADDRTVSAENQMLRKQFSGAYGLTIGINSNLTFLPRMGNTSLSNQETWIQPGVHIYGVECWLPGAVFRCAFYRDSDQPVEVVQSLVGTQPNLNNGPLQIGIGNGSTIAWSGILGSLYAFKLASANPSGVGALPDRERRNLVRYLSANWGVKLPPVGRDPNHAYAVALGSAPLDLVKDGNTAQRTTALPDAPLLLTAYAGATAGQSLNLIQATSVDAGASFGGYRYFLSATAYESGNERNAIWGANTLSNDVADWTRLIDNQCGWSNEADPQLLIDRTVIPARLYSILISTSTGPERLLYQYTTEADVTAWSACTEIGSIVLQGVETSHWTSPSLVTHPVTGAWMLYSTYRVSTAGARYDLRVRTAPAGVHWTQVDWDTLPYRSVQFHQGDPVNRTTNPNHTRVIRDGSKWYMLNYRATEGAITGQGTAFGTSDDGLHFYMARSSIKWQSTQTWCTQDYRWDFWRSAPGQFIAAGSCGGVGFNSRIFFATIYE